MSAEASPAFARRFGEASTELEERSRGEGGLSAEASAKALSPALRVECYAGHRGEQTPRAIVLGDRCIDVAEVLDAWLAPDHRYFKLRGADGATYLVRHDERSDTWQLTMFRV